MPPPRKIPANNHNTYMHVVTILVLVCIEDKITAKLKSPANVLCI